MKRNGFAERKGEKACYGRYPLVFQSELEALKSMLPVGKDLRGIEIGLSTGRFTEALGITEGVESSAHFRSMATNRGIKVIDGMAENLPYKSQSYDFALMISCHKYFNDLHVVFREAYRILNKNGILIYGFIDRDSILRNHCREGQESCPFYSHTNVNAVDKVIFELNLAEFKHFNFCQTLFNPIEKINQLEPVKPGYGEGSFVVIQAKKEY